jgi:hypothetical protein
VPAVRQVDAVAEELGAPDALVGTALALAAVW